MLSQSETHPLPVIVILLVLVLALGLGLCIRKLRRRGLDRWLPSYFLQALTRCSLRPGEPVHLLLCIADHYEPRRGNASDEVARNRVERWMTEYPRLFGEFR